MSDKNNNFSLNQRHTSEKIFHNSKYAKKNHHPRHYRLNPTYIVFQEMKKMIGDTQGKRVLEYGCGEGWTTLELAMLGGEIDSFDISSVAVDHAQRLLKKKRIMTNYEIRTMAAEQLEYPDKFFDIVVGFAILHHLDLKLAISEMYRVMKKGGLAFFAEPLGNNPIINIYRRFTPQYRTVDEKPLIMNDFKKDAKLFKNLQHKEFYITALLPLSLSYIRVSTTLIQHMMKYFLKLDDIILTRLPFMGRYAWYTIIRLEK